MNVHETRPLTILAVFVEDIDVKDITDGKYGLTWQRLKAIKCVRFPKDVGLDVAIREALELLNLIPHSIIGWRSSNDYLQHLLAQPCQSAPILLPADAPDEGIYALYYFGDFPPYAELAELNRDSCVYPIFANGTTLHIDAIADPGIERYGLRARLNRDVESIAAASNLSLDHFRWRILPTMSEDAQPAIGDIYRSFRPLWDSLNREILSGFNQLPDTQPCHYPFWDILHPGRQFVSREGPTTSAEELAVRVKDYLSRTIAIYKAETRNVPS